MTAKSDLIASLVQQEFDRLPAKRKPIVRDNGLREWVPLSGIVAEEKNGKLTCLSLATGMKCLPSSKLPIAKGNVLHDWHAEVLAIRAFNCFVLDECQAVASGSKSSSEFIRSRSRAEMTASPNSIGDHDYGDVDWHCQPFTWREDVTLHMYCSEAPCGDASMELTMASQADATPWVIPTVSPPGPFSSPSIALDPVPLDPGTVLPGRAFFSQLGIVRRKPSRGDAPPTLSKSCSDKLSLHQCTSLLSSPTSLLVSPDHAYVSTLILPTSQYSASGCRRAFSDGQGWDENDEGANSQQARMAPLAVENQSWNREGGYKFHPFNVKTTDLEFAFSRRASVTLPPYPSSSLPLPITDTSPSATMKNSTSKVKITPSNLSVALTASNREETTLNGVLQGRKASEATVRGASFASRRRTWALAVEVAGFLDADELNTQQIQHALGASTSSLATSPAQTTTASSPAKSYADLKDTPLLGPRRRAKEAARKLALKGWVQNSGDEDFSLNVDTS